ncbi:MAG: hypothetical protein KF742_01670 [Cryobacterium sp.]|nr:hypothetical protein [Cryobacterium sp.]
MEQPVGAQRRRERFVVSDDDMDHDEARSRVRTVMQQMEAARAQQRERIRRELEAANAAQDAARAGQQDARSQEPVPLAAAAAAHLPLHAQDSGAGARVNEDDDDDDDDDIGSQAIEDNSGEGIERGSRIQRPPAVTSVDLRSLEGEPFPEDDWMYRDAWIGEKRARNRAREHEEPPAIRRRLDGEHAAAPARAVADEKGPERGGGAAEQAPASPGDNVPSPAEPAHVPHRIGQAPEPPAEHPEEPVEAGGREYCYLCESEGEFAGSKHRQKIFYMLSFYNRIEPRSLVQVVRQYYDEYIKPFNEDREWSEAAIWRHVRFHSPTTEFHYWWQTRVWNRVLSELEQKLHGALNDRLIRTVQIVSNQLLRAATSLRGRTAGARGASDAGPSAPRAAPIGRAVRRP